MNVVQTKLFYKTVKKLHINQKRDLDQAVKAIIENPYSGSQKAGDLQDVMVYKFHMNNQLTLLAYTYHSETTTLTLLALGSHENFYTNLKRSLD